MVVNLLRNSPGIKVTELAESLGVSEGTIRNERTHQASTRRSSSGWG
ncbi:DeoR family transcriptional regulator [Thermanaerothrix daxensis]